MTPPAPTGEAYTIVIRARRFRWLSWPTVTTTFEKETTRVEAEALAKVSAAFGAEILYCGPSALAP